MTHMTDEEYNGAMLTAVATSDTIYREAYKAWEEFNPEWVFRDSYKDKERYTVDEMQRAFIEAWLQGFEKRLGG